MGARQRERRDRRALAPARWRCSASAAAWPRRETASRPASLRRPRIRGARGARGRRCAAASSCSTSRSRATARRSRYRQRGASRAARHGAVAVLVRSIGPDGLRLPHTGAARRTRPARRAFPPPRSAARTPTALDRMTARGDRVIVRLRMEAHAEPDVESANVVAEIRGRERPDEVVVVSGHLDSWDVGAGATDDGGGCVVSWEALRIMKKLNLRPRRTVRRRAVDQRRERRARRARVPRSAPRRARQARRDDRIGQRRLPSARLRLHGQRRRPPDGDRDCVAPVRSARLRHRRRRRRRRHHAERAGGSASPACRSKSTPRQYFTIHHTQADTVDKIDPVEMAKCAAAMTVMAYVLADLPERLGALDDMFGALNSGARSIIDRLAPPHEL